MGIKVSAKTEPSLEDVMKSEAFIPWQRYRLSDVDVTPLGTEAAVITYRVQATRQSITSDSSDDSSDDDDDDDEARNEKTRHETPGDDFRALVSSTWRRDPEAGKWLMVVQQQTPYQDEL